MATTGKIERYRNNIGKQIKLKVTKDTLEEFVLLQSLYPRFESLWLRNRNNIGKCPVLLLFWTEENQFKGAKVHSILKMCSKIIVDIILDDFRSINTSKLESDIYILHFCVY